MTAHREHHLLKAAEPCPKVTLSTKKEQTAPIQKNVLQKNADIKDSTKNSPDDVVNEGVNEGEMELKITL